MTVAYSPGSCARPRRWRGRRRRSGFRGRAAVRGWPRGLAQGVQRGLEPLATAAGTGQGRPQGPPVGLGRFLAEALEDQVAGDAAAVQRRARDPRRLGDALERGTLHAVAADGVAARREQRSVVAGLRGHAWTAVGAVDTTNEPISAATRWGWSSVTNAPSSSMTASDAWGRSRASRWAWARGNRRSARPRSPWRACRSGRAPPPPAWCGARRSLARASRNRGGRLLGASSETTVGHGAQRARRDARVREQPGGRPADRQRPVARRPCRRPPPARRPGIRRRAARRPLGRRLQRGRARRADHRRPARPRRPRPQR